MSWDVRILILFLEEEMKRKLASLLLCGALSLSVLTGCGGSNEESAAQSDVKTIFTLLLLLAKVQSFFVEFGNGDMKMMFAI